MTEKDYAAMLELASDMPWKDACFFIRAETGDGLRAANSIAEQAGRRFPDSVLAGSLAKRAENAA